MNVRASPEGGRLLRWAASTVSLTDDELAEIERSRRRIEAGISDWCTIRDDAERVGAILFSSLFESEEEEKTYRKALAAVESAGQAGNAHACLHFRLNLGEESLSLPWEYLYDPIRGTFVGSLPYVSVERGCGAAWNPQAPQRSTRRSHPLKMLVVLASPAIHQPPNSSVPREIPPVLDTLQFFSLLDRLQQKVSPEALSIERLHGREATHSKLRESLAPGNQYDVLCFCGHSYVHDLETFLLLEDGSEVRRGNPLNAEIVGEWLQTSKVRTVIFSSCQSIAGASCLSRLGHLESVVGMQMEMPNLSCSAFDETLLESIVFGEVTDHAVRLGRQRIRQFLRDHSSGQGLQDLDRPDWAIPVLFTRADGPRPNWCELPAGDYPVGLTHSELRRLAEAFQEPVPSWLQQCVREQERVHLQRFHLSRWPVTNMEYTRYLTRTGQDVSDSVRSDPLKPVVRRTWQEASDYCHWAGGRLPTDDEWEAGVRGPQGLLFPWGDDFQPARCVTRGSPCLQPVNSLPGGAASSGCEGMCGNVFEWTTGGDDQRRQVVGGSWKAQPVFTLPSLRTPRDPRGRYDDVGFRVAYGGSGT